MKKLRRLAAAASVAAVLVASAAACGWRAAPAGGAEDPVETRIFTDSAGREVELPSKIAKVSPSGPLAQMFLLAIAPDLLVSAASEYSEESLKYIPDAVEALPVVGQFYGADNLNLETIASINPDIVIDVGEPKDTIAEDMDSIEQTTAIPAVHVTASLRSAPQAFRTLGVLLGREEKGEALASYCQRALGLADDAMARVGGDKVSALYCLGDAGLNVIARSSYHSEVIDLLTDNLAVVDNPSSKGIGNETDLEQISVWDPDVIVFAPDSIYGDVQSDAVWSNLRAIRGGRYYETPFGPYNWMGSPPSINRYLGMLWLTSALYPDYADYDLYEEVREYYGLFYGYDLSRDEFDAFNA
ncbi:MAG: ABC transporter substrate-binding protein [Oscillospiraceae bacterium]|jgi:iron complex transport system substrate-binding protein|nr:ABC transporter substrate-binding protein [Oscillospiraceae bacterium]